MKRMYKVGLGILKFYLRVKASKKYIKNYIASKKTVKSRNLDCIDNKRICVAAVQERIEILDSCKAYVDKMYDLTLEAVSKGAQLVVFPEENGLLCLGMIPFIKLVLNKAGSGSPNENLEDANEDNFDLTGIFSYLTPFIKDVFETVFSSLAREFGVYIMAGSTMLMEGGCLYNRAYLYGPDGGLVGTQDKAHLAASEIPMGIKTADELKVFDTSVGKLAFPVCMDASYFETFKILKNKGAQIVMIPIANIEEYDPYLALRGIWPRVQEYPLYGIKSALVGNLFGFGLTGKAGIFAPLGLTENRSGVIQETDDWFSEKILCSFIDLTLLEEWKDPYFGDSNPEFYSKYYPDIYDNLDCMLRGVKCND